LIFGDSEGNVILSDSNLVSTDRKYKIFRKQVLAVSYVLDPMNHNQQYCVAIGDDSTSKGTDNKQQHSENDLSFQLLLGYKEFTLWFCN
jgi:hypothetical protein